MESRVLVVDVTDGKAVERTFTWEGRQIHSRSQDIYVHTGKAVPECFTVRLDDLQPPYQPGRYVLAAGTIERDQKKGWQLARSIALVPVVDAVKALQAAATAAPFSPVVVGATRAAA